MAQEELARGAVSIIERIEEENRAKSLQKVELDGSNKVSFPGFPYTFRALNEKILVSVDVFKSGYECRVCKETGKLKKFCECETSGRPGKKYTTDQIAEIKETLGHDIAAARTHVLCPECQGNYMSKREEVTCSACKGTKVILELPGTSKSQPTTGVIVSMGHKAKDHLEAEGIKLGDRILFGAYAGTMIPTKAGAAFKYMDWYLAVVKIEGAENMAAFDFVLNEGE